MEGFERRPGWDEILRTAVTHDVLGAAGLEEGAWQRWGWEFRHKADLWKGWTVPGGPASSVRKIELQSFSREEARKIQVQGHQVQTQREEMQSENQSRGVFPRVD